jgi:hypothetical protein
MEDENKAQKKRVGTLADFFAAAPLRNSGLVIARGKCVPCVPDFAMTGSDAGRSNATDVS